MFIDQRLWVYTKREINLNHMNELFVLNRTVNTFFTYVELLTFLYYIRKEKHKKEAELSYFQFIFTFSETNIDFKICF